MPNSSLLALVPSQLPSPSRLIVDNPPNLNDVRLGLRNREFRAYLQPKFDLLTGAVYGVEVLARWEHPVRGLLGPADFIPLMVRERLLDELLQALLEQCLACQLRLYRRGRLVGFAFNLSLGQLMDDTLVDHVSRTLRAHPLPASTLTFEITEDGPASACARSVEQLKRIARLGVRLSLDDFGTGYSSLWRLCQAPFSEIKLAGEFTRCLDDPAQYRVIVRHTLALADEMGMQLVVEGIETEAQRLRLSEMGVRRGQGYACAPAMPMASLEEFQLYSRI